MLPQPDSAEDKFIFIFLLLEDFLRQQDPEASIWHSALSLFYQSSSQKSEKNPGGGHDMERTHCSGLMAWCGLDALMQWQGLNKTVQRDRLMVSVNKGYFAISFSIPIRWKIQQGTQPSRTESNVSDQSHVISFLSVYINRNMKILGTCLIS